MQNLGKERKNDLDVMNSSSLAELFAIVKKIVYDYAGHHNSNVKLKVSNLGYFQGGFTAGHYNYLTNIITINASPLKDIARRDKKILKYYAFQVLLHEYIHSLGIANEFKTRKLTYQITRDYFGETHMMANMAEKSLAQLFKKQQCERIIEIVIDFYE